MIYYDLSSIFVSVIHVFFPTRSKPSPILGVLDAKVSPYPSCLKRQSGLIQRLLLQCGGSRSFRILDY